MFTSKAERPRPCQRSPEKLRGASCPFCVCREAWGGRGPAEEVLASLPPEGTKCSSGRGKKPGGRGPFASAATGSAVTWLPSQASIHPPCPGHPGTSWPSKRCLHCKTGSLGALEGCFVACRSSETGAEDWTCLRGAPLDLGVACCLGARRQGHRAMSDLLLLGLIGGLTLLLLLTLLAFARHSGLLAGVAVSAGSPPIRNVTMAYKFHVGPYSETGRLFTESYSVCPRLRSVAIYYDNPHLVSPEKRRCAVGSILSEGEESPCPELLQLYQKLGFKVFSFPAPSHVVTATFPYTTALSIWLAARRVHPALDTYIKERKLCAHPRLEIYQQDQIYFVCPLARQGDFYVPEVKETERKSRGPVEASDAQTDGAGADRTSEGSSVSLEVGPGSRETSAATLSPGASGRGWDDSDNRSEHSYSESGASGSSFEELDLEGEGPLGEPRLSPEAEPPGTPKRARELSTPEKGEE